MINSMTIYEKKPIFCKSIVKAILETVYKSEIPGK